ncbi:NADPH:quinone reductase-like Zn-dependent oxidoreductase [Microcella putealis]|uniref:NADPH:quinone reductase-like Zn-dependent oxidoreductase n=1 Tax=Microcella putealis TaxID=337005 RepID=A0A4Q7LT02_9MICO|nr:NAD(P)-dependent alcohol dehydrogenase [Microcella putealis]RZS57523.1 NADPH:quinone reductase-like Zn-dependent oxidoreductase [Microcella putealis]TQM24590.1 NADPH:quinone reductase-like Zn-dependent oxidoreductase [Microcella putealis]
MKAVVARRYGGPEALEIVDAPVPEPAEGQVRVRVAASSVNPLDWHEMRGTPYLLRLARGLVRPTKPALGSDLAGTVDAVGPGVSSFAVGDEVLGYGNGAWAEYTVVGEKGLAHRPAGLAVDEAAGLGIAAVTALQALRRGGLDAPRTWNGTGVEPMPPRVMIIGATGGVGSIATQLAAHFGAHVTAVTGAGNRELALRLGAEEVLDYRTDRLDDGLARYDLVVETNGARRTRELARLLTPNGVLAVVGAPPGDWVAPVTAVAGRAVANRLTTKTIASILARRDADDLAALADLAGAGAIRTVVGEVYPLERIADAVRHSESGHVRGKLIVRVAP